MTDINSNKHLTFSERTIIETGVTNGSTKAAIALCLGKDKSTIGKEIKSHRLCSHKCNLPLECINYKKCKFDRLCKVSCPSFVQFKCTRRDRSPGVCNGCDKMHSCHFNHFRYSASDAEHEYRTSLVDSRMGVNSTEEDIIKYGSIIQPLIKKGLSPYAILSAHPEIPWSESTIYNYIESGVFKNAGIDLISLDLRTQVSRKITKRLSNQYKQRKDRKYLIGRTYNDYLAYIESQPNAHIVEMDTVYNDITNGPFMQTFKFMSYGFMFIVYHTEKTAETMYNGILLLEKILGEQLFNYEVEVLLTDRGSEFSMAEQAEMRDDGSRRTRVFYCDPMASRQKGSIEQNHKSLRYICPKNHNLYALGLDSQDKANRIVSHVNSMAVEKYNGKSVFEVMEFMNPNLASKFINFGIEKINPDNIILKPYLLK